MSDNVKFVIDNVEFSNFNSFSIVRTIDSIADGFVSNFKILENKLDYLKSLKPFKYQECKIFIDNELIFTGFLEKIENSLSVDDFSITISGRSRPGVLVEASCEEFSQFFNATLGEIANSICGYFGVSVLIEEDSKKFSSAYAMPGETVFEFLSRLSRDAGLFLSCNAAGQLVIKKVLKVAPSANFIEGEGILRSIFSNYDSTSRYSKFIVAAQASGYSSIKSIAYDKSISIYKPLFIDGGSTLDFSKKSIYIKNKTIKSSFDVVLDVDGWRNATKRLFSPGDIIILKSPSCFIFEEFQFILSSVATRFDTDGGFRSSLSIDFYQSFTQEEISEFPWD